MTIDPYDEVKINAEDTIIRRINPHQHVIWDDNKKKHRISSKAFNKSSGLKAGMSVDIENLINRAGKDPRIYVKTPVFIGSVAFLARDIRALELWIGYDPVPDNPYHGEVWTKVEKKSFTETQKKGLANSARWYVELPPDEFPNVDIV